MNRKRTEIELKLRRELTEIKERRKGPLLRREGIEGVGVGRDEMVVYARPGVEVEERIEDKPVKVIRTDPFTFLTSFEDELQKYQSLCRYREDSTGFNFYISSPDALSKADHFFFNAFIYNEKSTALGTPIDKHCWWFGSVPSSSGGTYKILMWDTGKPETFWTDFREMNAGTTMIFDNRGTHKFTQRSGGIHTGCALYRYEGEKWILKDYLGVYEPVVPYRERTRCPRFDGEKCLEECKKRQCTKFSPVRWWGSWASHRDDEDTECVNWYRSIKDTDKYYPGRPCYFGFNKPRCETAMDTTCPFFDFDPPWPPETLPSGAVVMKCYHPKGTKTISTWPFGCDYWHHGWCNFKDMPENDRPRICSYWTREGDHFKCTKYGYKGYEYICRYVKKQMSFYKIKNKETVCTYTMDSNPPSLEETKPRLPGEVTPPAPCISHKKVEECTSAGCYWWSDSVCRSTPEPTEPRRKKWRPCPPGIALEVVKGFGWGTFGAVVLKNGQKKILSNNHVLAAFNQAAIGDDILQPAGGEVLAKLEQFVPIKSGETNYVDCAIANPIQQADIIPNIPMTNDYEPSFIPTGVAEAYTSQMVAKSGARSGYTYAQVLSIGSSLQIKFGGMVVTFDDIIVTTSTLSEVGDSGSLVVDSKTLKAVGLLFAGSSTTSAACTIQNVLKALGCTLYTTEAPPPKKSSITFKSVPTGASISLKKK